MNILIIDDDKFVTRTLEDSLSTHGHAVEVINKSSQIKDNVSIVKDYDCVILDLMMRSFPGLELLPGEETGEGIFRMIKRYDKNKPVIVITGKDLSDIKTKFSKTKTQVILKPFSSRLSEIYEAINNV